LAALFYISSRDTISFERIKMGYQRFYPQQSESSSVGSFLAGLGIGVLLGAALGVISAPHRGDVTRRTIVRQAGATRDQVVEAVEDFVERRADGSEVDNGEA
jgi:hypothetical protein